MSKVHVRNLLFFMLTIVLTVVLSGDAALGQSSSFTYQGRLTDGATTANGNYDLQVALFDSLAGNTQIGQTQIVPNVLVSAGVFTVTLDFGPDAFAGASRFLEMSVRPSGAAAFTLLTPRQPITSTPYAVRSLNAANAATAANAQLLGGVAPSQYVKTDDARLADARDPKAGSSNYVQNTSSPQASANFNISGNGTAGGTLSANTVNAATQYNLSGQPALGVSAQNVLKLGNTGNVGIGPTFSPFFKLEVESTDKFGLRVGTGVAGGAALSIGGIGSLQVDAPGTVAGRFVVSENGNVGIGTPNPGYKLTVAGGSLLGGNTIVGGTLESTGGYKFPDGSMQSTAANTAIGKVYTTGSVVTELEIAHGGYDTDIGTLNLPPGLYMITATVQFENRANDFLQDNTRTVRCYVYNGSPEFVAANHMGAQDDPMDWLSMTVHTVISRSSTAPVSLKCGNTDSGGKVFARNRRLTAIRVADNPN